MDLNPEQKIAVNHTNGPCLVTAIPGSGKTRVLTSRAVRLITEVHVPPYNILCITFTNRAANEMEERIKKELGAKGEGIWVSTFHRLCLAVMRKHCSKIGLLPSFSIYDESDQYDLMAKIIRMHEHDQSASKPFIQMMCRICNDHREDCRKLDSADPIFVKNFNERTGVGLTELKIIEEYLEHIDSLNAVDFSGMLYKTYTLITQYSEISTELSNRFKYVMVDESQDMNNIQYEIVKKISKHGNIFMVGDYSQSIFSWRGAKPENMVAIKGDFENVTSITLPRNYRSTDKILACAERLIKNNSTSQDVVLISEKGSGHDVNLDEFWSAEDEAENVANLISHIKFQDNLKWSDFAVLYRTNIQSKNIEMALRNMGTPYRVYGGLSFYNRSEIKTALAYLTFVANPTDTVAFARCIMSPKRGIGEQVVGKLERVCHTKNMSILTACKHAGLMPGISSTAKKGLDEFTSMMEKCIAASDAGQRIVSVATDLMKDSGYYDFLKKASQEDPSYQKRIDNLDEFLVSLDDFQKQKPKSKITDFLHNVQLMSSDTGEEDDSVHLLTMHSAKGLEFPVVFIVGAENKIIPHYKSLEGAALEEERRLMYVAVTRSCSRLFVSFCRKRKRFSVADKKGSSISCYPSPFLTEMMGKEII